MQDPEKKRPIRIKINTTFAIGDTAAFQSQFNQNGDLILELDPGSTVQELLLRLPGLGAPENWSDLFLHVFVNHKVAPLTGSWKTMTSWISIFR